MKWIKIVEIIVKITTMVIGVFKKEDKKEEENNEVRED